MWAREDQGEGYAQLTCHFLSRLLLAFVTGMEVLDAFIVVCRNAVENIGPPGA